MVHDVTYIVSIDVLLLFSQEHGQEFNGDSALQELYDYVRKYQDQVILDIPNLV